MKCLECRGACCESFTAEITMYPPNNDASRWLELHATKVDPPVDDSNREYTTPKLTFECRCTKLTSEGLCSIWEDRPLVCELYIAGSQQCLNTVRERRTPEDYQRIRDDEDPEIIHT